MSDIDNAFTVDKLSLSDLVLVVEGSADPSVVGYEAPTGSLFLKEDGTIFTKTAVGNSAWIPGVRSDDKRINVVQRLVVSKDPGPGQFSSIKQAMDSITTASSLMPWVISVWSGIYYEDTIDAKPYVTISGAGRRSVKIVANNPNANLINACPSGTISNLTLSGATGVGSAAIHFEPTFDGDTYHGLDLHFESNYHFVHLKVNAGIHIGIVDLADITVDETAASVNPFLCESTGGGTAYLYINAFRTRFFIEPTTFIDCHGAGAVIGLWDSLAILQIGTPVAHGVHLYDGGTVTLQGVQLLGWDVGIHAPNTGAAPSLTASGVFLNSATSDLLIEHPGTIGAFVGSVDQTKLSIVDTAPLSLSFTHTTTSGTSVVGELYIGATANTLTSVTDLIQMALPTGKLSGGDVTRGTGTPLDVVISAGFGYVIDSTTQREKRIVWGTTTLTLPDNTAELHIFIDNNGAVSYGTSEPLTTENIFLAHALTMGGGIFFISYVPSDANSSATYIDNYLRRAIGPIFGYGASVTEDTTTPRRLDITSGMYYFSKQEIAIIGASPILCGVMHHSTGGAWVGSLPGTDPIDNAQYDDGTGLVNLTPGYYTKHSLYVGGQGAEQKFMLIYGQTEFSTLLAAQNAPLPTPPAFIPEDAAPIASLIMQEGTNSIVQIYDIRPRLGFTAPAISSTGVRHGDLLGLSNDDHPQYLLASGARALGGDLNMGTHNVTNVGLVDGIDVSAHGAGHGANSVDPVPTAAPLANISLSTTNAAGIADTLSRSDHSHAISGVQPLNSFLTSVAGNSSTGIVIKNGTSSLIRSIMAGSAKITVSNGDGVAGNPTVDLGSVSLGNLANVVVPTPTAGDSLVFNGTNWVNGAVTPKLYAENPVSQVTPVSTGTNAIALGSAATAGAHDSIAIGIQSLSRLPGIVQANGRFTTQGDAQSGRYLVRTGTINGSPTEMFLDGTGGTERLTLTPNTTWVWEATIVVHETDGPDYHAGFKLKGVTYCGASLNTIMMLGSPSKEILARSRPAWNVVASVDTAHGALKFTVTGEAGQTIRWFAVVETTEVTN